MTHDQAAQSQLRQAHEKRLSSLNIERALLHSCLQARADDALIACAADHRGRVIQPGDGLTLLVYLVS